MKPSIIRAALAAAIIGVGTAGGIALAQAFNPASAPSPGYGPGYGGMGPGMMQVGSMGPGMMQPYQQPERPPTASSAGNGASHLVEYIQAQRLSCLQCHSVAGGGYAPPFAFIAQREAGRPGVESLLAGRIAGVIWQHAAGTCRPGPGRADCRDDPGAGAFSTRSRGRVALSVLHSVQQ